MDFTESVVSTVALKPMPTRMSSRTTVPKPGSS
jgi:hypothetical protein